MTALQNGFEVELRMKSMTKEMLPRGNICLTRNANKYLRVNCKGCVTVTKPKRHMWCAKEGPMLRGDKVGGVAIFCFDRLLKGRSYKPDTPCFTGFSTCGFP